jgi:hypothetical protein
MVELLQHRTSQAGLEEALTFLQVTAPSNAVTLLLRCCYAAVTLLFRCCYTVVTLLSHRQDEKGEQEQEVRRLKVRAPYNRHV